MTPSDIDKTRQHIARLGALMYERRLTDAAGGNISARVGDVVCITPRFSGSKHQWQLRPEQVLVVDWEGRKLDGDGDISREAKAHLRLLSAFPVGRAVVHGHPQSALVFCVLRQPIPPVLESTLKFGTVPVAEFAPAHSAQLAENLCACLAGQEERIKKQAAAVLAPWHGLFVLGKDLDAAYDAFERIDGNARLLLQMGALQNGTVQSLAFDTQQALQAAIASFQGH